jgi:hypothetical protein
MIEVVGQFSEKIIKALGLSVAVGTEIYFSDSSFEHALERHNEVSEYIKFIADILEFPDFVSCREDKTVCFIRQMSNGEEFCLVVPVRSASDGKHFVRTLYRINEKRFSKQVTKGFYMRLTDE